jgi:branched-chain amino acid transport system ATP-binding protein
MPLLEVKNIDVFYGEAQALFDVSLNIEKEECVALLGRNGVGKTTTLKAIMGVNPPKRGEIIFNNNDVTHWASDKTSRSGIGWIPEDRKLFGELTVMENLRVAAAGTRDHEGIDKVLELLPVLKKYVNTKASNLSGGEQKMLTIARSLIGNKTLLMFDEPSEGLAPSIVEIIRNLLFEIKSLGQGIILVEQNTPLALELSDRVYIMRSGTIVFEGEPSEVMKNKKAQSYLTVSAD